ncbi:DUF4421 family protein [uncultured Bacteroides sp.]|uniref:DUF4421 family protein n=1 Tax=uncultured Bacteroides sp. TaxID=162156 RepID=UPI00262D70AD|nr:DUF4421 family protein [uncultured Bacteroides sp.]
MVVPSAARRYALCGGMGQEASEQEVVRQEASEYAESHSKGKLLMWLDHLFDKLSVSKSDTLYAVRNNYRFSIKPRMGISVGIFGFDWKQDGERQEYILNSAPVFKLGANFSYRNLTIGFQRDVERLFKGKQTNNAEFGASLYGTMLGGDYFYSSSNRYTIRSEQDKEWHLRVSCFRSRRLQANGYWVLNHHRFSYPAVFTQSYRQKRSCGSVVLGLSLHAEQLELDTDALPDELVARLHASMLPTVSTFKRARLKFPEHTEHLSVDKVNVGGIARLGVLWDRSRNFAGFTTVINMNNLGHRPVDISSFYVRNRVFYGVRF